MLEPLEYDNLYDVIREQPESSAGSSDPSASVRSKNDNERLLPTPEVVKKFKGLQSQRQEDWITHRKRLLNQMMMNMWSLKDSKVTRRFSGVNHWLVP